MPNTQHAKPSGPRAGQGGYRMRVTNPQATNQQPASKQAAPGESFYPGQDLGLPEYGAGSVTGWSRRLGALLIDWFACTAIAVAFLYHPTAGHYSNVLVQPKLWTPVVFGIEDFLLTGLTGWTLGKRLLGIRVIRIDRRPVGLPRAFIRTLLLMLVVPAMMMDRDLRGLQDKAAGTIVVRTS
jgi:uncharacterized RDD family membrane protein YckC